MVESAAQGDGVDDAVTPRLVALAATEGERQHGVCQRIERGDEIEGLKDEADLLATQLGELFVVQL